MDKIIITGGLGFIGKNLIEYLFDKYELVVIDIRYDDSFKILGKIKVIINDFSNKEVLTKIFQEERPNYIINLISFVDNNRDISNFQKHLDVNFFTLIKIYESSKDIESLKLIIQMGSAEEYGLTNIPFKEIDREYPISPYAIIKQLTTNTSLMLYQNFNYPVCIIRPTNLFGNYQDRNKIIPYIIDSLSNNSDIKLSSCKQKRDFLYIKDFCYYVSEILNDYENSIGNIINIGSGFSYSIEQLAINIKTIMNSNSNIISSSSNNRENKILDLICDLSYIQKKFKCMIYNEKVLFDRIVEYSKIK